MAPSLCHKFATYTARSGGQRNGTLELVDFTPILSVAYGTEKDPTDTFVLEIGLSNGKTYFVQYLPDDDQIPNGNAEFVSLFCGQGQGQ
jgi:hypothetical protein